MDEPQIEHIELPMHFKSESDEETIEQAAPFFTDVHIKSEICEEDPFSTDCDVCDEQCSNYEELIHHKQLYHQIEGNIAKPEQFLDSFNSTGHVYDDAHLGVKIDIKPNLEKLCIPIADDVTKNVVLGDTNSIHNCDICDKNFKYSGSLKSHRARHANELPFKCQICSMGYKYRSHLEIHMRRHTGEKPYQCDICNSGFKQSVDLKIHRRHHTGEKPFKCSYCEKCFSVNSNLKIHLRQHTGEKPYKCDFCDMRFKNSSGMRSHQRQHTGEKPYECNICGRRFSWTSNLKKHQYTHW